MEDNKNLLRLKLKSIGDKEQEPSLQMLPNKFLRAPNHPTNAYE